MRLGRISSLGQQYWKIPKAEDYSMLAEQKKRPMGLKYGEQEGKELLDKS